MPDAIRILHAEDDPDFADLTATYLQREDERFEVTTASDTTVAHEHLATHEFDCIVSDHDMPGENGIEFLTSVRAEFPDLPFILFTGKGSEEVASEAISAGVTDYLQKATGAEQYELLANRIGTAVEQYRTKSRLERQNDLFRQAQDIATIGAWEYDVESDQTYVTDELLRIHGLGLDVALPPEKSLSYYHPEDRELVADAFNRAIDTGESYDLEARLITEDGRKRWVRTRGVPQSEDGNTVRLRGILQDITEQKHREVNLERQNERLEEFAHVVSHDIRNPLQVASGRLDLAEQTGSDEAFQKVRQAHERIEAIIEDLLVLAQQGQQIGQTVSVDIDTIAQNAWETVGTETITLRTIAGGQVEADPDRLRQLFENLFRNAAEHAGPDVTVTVGPIQQFHTTTRSQDTDATGFFVADDGPGISADIRDQVFESGVTTTDSGTGFGLAIVAQIADAHGWDVSATESNTGGARFEFHTHPSEP